jgi:prepilin-type processing-associated H-X9-DG protein
MKQAINIEFIFVLILCVNSFVAVPILSFGSPSTNTALNNEPPTLNIVAPNDRSTIVSEKVDVNGTAFDAADGIKKVEVLISPYPFNNTIRFQPAVPLNEFAIQQDSETQLLDEGEDSAASEGKIKRENFETSDWSKWSITLPINASGAYRILAHAIDGAGKENWDETRIIVPYTAASTTIGSDAVKRIAIVEPTFTQAAYIPNAFYTFYGKHHEVSPGEIITADIEMLTAKIHTPYYFRPESSIDIKNLTIFSPPDPDNRKIVGFGTHLQKLMPNNIITIIRDEDIHNGNILLKGTERNVYDMLIVFHDEYATQQMYDNYKRFVSNGGNILFMDGNVLYAEVKFNQENNTVSLVKGHGWESDGQSAKRSVEERWFNENREFIGSNFLLSDLGENITFTNNPFNYTHFEENFVNNDNAKILIDYGALIPKWNAFSGSRVASYELEHESGGKIIMIGLYGIKLLENKSFIDFVETLILKNL